MSHEWIAECVNYFTTDENIKVHYVPYEDCLKRGILPQQLEQRGDVHFVTPAEVFDLRRVQNNLNSMHFFVGKHHVKLAECKYWHTFCIMLYCKFRPAIIVIDTPFSKVNLQFHRKMFDALKTTVLLQLYNFYWMRDINFSEEM